jgi:hypothetical protein
MGKYDNMFAHIVIEPVADDREDNVLSFAAKHGCLAHIENVCYLSLENLVRFVRFETIVRGLYLRSSNH